MRPWSRATLDEYRRLPLRAHSLLADVPLHDVWRVALPGGGPSRTMRDVRSVFQAARRSQSLSPPVRALFALRWLLGRLFRWDGLLSEPEAWSFRRRLNEADRRQSIVEPGTLDGPFTVLYVHTMEAVSEIRNATVHAFLVWAVEDVLSWLQKTALVIGVGLLAYGMATGRVAIPVVSLQVATTRIDQRPSGAYQ